MNKPQLTQDHKDNRIIVGLDWDGTVTTNPDAFFKIAKIFKEAGYGLYIVTMRYRSECHNIPDHWINLVDGLICTSRRAKKEVTEEQGVHVHIWIDDNPAAVYLCAQQVFGSSSPEGFVVTPSHREDIADIRE